MGGPIRTEPYTALAILAALGEMRAHPAAIFNILTYNLAAAIELGLKRQAAATLAALQTYLRDHPGLNLTPTWASPPA